MRILQKGPALYRWSRRQTRALSGHVSAALLLIGAAPLQSCGGQGTDPSAPPPPTYDVPASVDGTGATDVTVALTDFLASVPDTAIIRFSPGATYRIEGTLLLQNRLNLTIDGNGATFVATTDGTGVTGPPLIDHNWPRGRRHWMFSGGSGITIKNMTIRGANPLAGTGDSAYVVTLEAQHGIEFSGVEGAEVSGVTITDVYGDFIYLGPRGPVWTSHVHVHDNHFERNGRQGIAITGASDVLIEANYIAQVRRASTDIEPNTASGGAHRVHIRNNTFGPGRLLFLASGGAAGSVEAITIERNTLVGKPLNILVRPPAGSRRKGIRIIDNTSDREFGSPGAMMNFDRIDGLEVRGNHNPLSPTRDMTGVEVTESCDVVVTGNQFEGAAREAVIVPHSC